MISYQEALGILIAQAKRRCSSVPVEKIALTDSVGRVLGAAITATDNNPRFDNSAMDGFLVESSRCKNASKSTPVILEVLSVISAGSGFEGSTKEDRFALEIMTGAPVPKGVWDAVVKVEDVSEQIADSKRIIQITTPLNAGENIRFSGEDFKRGDLLAQKGSLIGCEHVLTLATCGIKEVQVYKDLRVGFFSTGNEVVPFDGVEPGDFQIRNSTAPFLASALEQYGVSANYLGVARDEKEALRSIILEAIEPRPDVVISTGGVSAGKFDLVKEVLLEIGATVFFHKALVRPGKPILFAELPGSNSVFFGLPGNPVSVASGIRFFVKPYMRALLGQAQEYSYKLPLAGAIGKPSGLTFFQRGVREGCGVRAISAQGSAMVGSLGETQGWIVADPSRSSLEVGETVEWYSLW